MSDCVGSAELQCLMMRGCLTVLQQGHCPITFIAGGRLYIFNRMHRVVYILYFFASVVYTGWVNSAYTAMSLARNFGQIINALAS